jgi:hypothetical protein
VNHLAERARAADGPPVVEPVAKAADIKVASIAATPIVETVSPAPPPAAPIEPTLPDPSAVAKVAAAVGPEHAIELPTDDPTASPIVLVDVVAGDEEPLVETAALDARMAFDEDDASDETQTAAIAPDEEQPEATPKPKKPKTAKAKPAKAQPAETEVASLPGVDIGGLAGHPSGDGADTESTVRTVTKPAKSASKNLGGVPAGSARVTAAVNMRSGPQKGAGVMMVVPAGSAVKVLSCNGWCQIAYNGQKGWVYKNFLASAKPQKAQNKQQTAASPQDSTPAEPAPPARKVQSSRL